MRALVSVSFPVFINLCFLYGSRQTVSITALYAVMTFMLKNLKTGVLSCAQNDHLVILFNKTNNVRSICCTGHYKYRVKRNKL